ncbi:hypothetical protein LPJ71_005824 [Coemansia sp. S17]|nr:hypothetical protein LPJ71_005824 [Coemansia sp. S17]
MLLIYKVVEYLEGRSKHKLDLDVNTHNKLKVALVPLLSVSEHWRRAALESICDTCTLDFDQPYETRKIVFPAWPADFKHTRLCKTNLVKRAVFPATLGRTVVDKIANEGIRWLQCRGVVAPNARTMLLCLRKAANHAASPDNNPTLASAPTSTTEQQSLGLFARYLLQMVPSVTGITVFIPSIDAVQSELSQMYDSLISTLCRGRVKALYAYSVQGTIPISLNFLGVSGLTSIANGVNIGCAPFAQLIFRNSRTLKTINFRFAAESNWRDMIHGHTQTPTVYTHLTTLTLTIIGIPHDTTWAAIDDIAPFPALSTLDVSDRYPFDDDLLFRGNGRTMKNLRLPFRAIARNILARFNILKRSGVSRMNSISIGAIYNEDIAFMANRVNVIIRQQVHHILETTTKFSIVRDIADRPSTKIFKAIELTPSTSILRHLDFGISGVVYITGVIKLINALPTLVILTCHLGDLGLADKVAPESTYPSSLRSTNYPLSKNFRLLRVPHASTASACTIAKISMLVAIVCPNFAHVDMAPELRNAFSREIAWGTCNRPFEPYADSIRRLIYKD